MIGRIEGPATLPLAWGGRTVPFTLWHYTFDSGRWVSAYAGDLAAVDPVPLRIESACLFGHLLGSRQCDCGYQLDAAMRQFCAEGRGLLLYGVDQDARGLGIEAHFAIYRMRQLENLDTTEVYTRLNAPIDARDYAPVAEILRHLNVRALTLLTNNPRREEFLRSEGFEVVTRPLEAPLDVHNMSTLMLEKEDLGYTWSFETHADWLDPLQAAVADQPGTSAAQLVAAGPHGPASLLAQARDQGAWSLARSLAAAAPPARPEKPLVVYLTDLPRTDELAVYAGVGATTVVIPFTPVPEWLRRAAPPGLRLVDWARRNAHRRDRPQWELLDETANVRAYRREQAIRLVVAEPAEKGRVEAALHQAGVASTGSGADWVEYAWTAHGAGWDALARIAVVDAANQAGR